jgi:hypothetical protein
MGRSRGKKRRKRKELPGVKLGIKEKRQENGRRRMERKVYIGNKWWEIMTIYSKEMKTTG